MLAEPRGSTSTATVHLLLAQQLQNCTCPATAFQKKCSEEQNRKNITVTVRAETKKHNQHLLTLMVLQGLQLEAAHIAIPDMMAVPQQPKEVLNGPQAKQNSDRRGTTTDLPSSHLDGVAIANITRVSSSVARCRLADDWAIFSSDTAVTRAASDAAVTHSGVTSVRHLMIRTAPSQHPYAAVRRRYIRTAAAAAAIAAAVTGQRSTSCCDACAAPWACIHQTTITLASHANTITRAALPTCK
jgi:hypothetical protein